MDIRCPCVNFGGSPLDGLAGTGQLLRVVVHPPHRSFMLPGTAAFLGKGINDFFLVFELCHHCEEKEPDEGPLL